MSKSFAGSFPGKPEHLGDEAVAAYADNVLTGGPRNRAARHLADCPECNYAVAVQRQAVWALRAAPAPSLPTGLLDRLRDVAVTTPIRQVPTHIDPDGTTMFSVAAPAFVAQAQAAGTGRRHRGRTIAIAAFSVAALGAAGVITADSIGSGPAARQAPAQLVRQPGIAVH